VLRVAVLPDVPGGEPGASQRGAGLVEGGGAGLRETAGEQGHFGAAAEVPFALPDAEAVEDVPDDGVEFGHADRAACGAGQRLVRAGQREGGGGGRQDAVAAPPQYGRTVRRGQ
jgi:hypothetical protein